MRRRWLFSWFCSLAWLTLVVTALLGARNAAACGALAGPRGVAPAELPFLTVERVLLVWDKDTGTEDFVREARFDRAGKAFGFVVPVPTLPEVAAVAQAPFDALEVHYPFEPVRAPTGLAVPGRGASGAGEAPSPVVVLAQQRIGSFTAFTLSATDAGALDRWLADNGFEMTVEARPWTARYVASGYYFVAFRYEPKAAQAATAGMTSETVRIRFHTPNPFYPYMEPVHAGQGRGVAPRMLSGWLVTREQMSPVSARSSTVQGQRAWERPWQAGLMYRPSADELGKVLEPALSKIVPSAGPLIVQTFRDTKPSREGYGDVVLVPSKAEAPNAAADAARRTLLSAVDPTLVEESWVTPPPASPTKVAPPAEPWPAAPREEHRCSIGHPGASPALGTSAVMLGVCATLLLARRTRRRTLVTFVAAVAAALLVTSCRKPHPDADPRENTVVVPPPSVPPPFSLGSRAAREANGLALLRGEEPAGAILPRPVWSPAISGNVQTNAQLSRGTLPDFHRVLAGVRPRFRRCFWAAPSAPVAGRVVTLDFDIAPNGDVTGVREQGDARAPDFISSCCAVALKKSSFAATTEGGAGTVSLTFTQD
jgi:hypothetical protein